MSELSCRRLQCCDLCARPDRNSDAGKHAHAIVKQAMQLCTKNKWRTMPHASKTPPMPTTFRASNCCRYIHCLLMIAIRYSAGDMLTSKETFRYNTFASLIHRCMRQLVPRQLLAVDMLELCAQRNETPHMREQNAFQNPNAPGFQEHSDCVAASLDALTWAEKRLTWRCHASHMDSIRPSSLLMLTRSLGPSAACNQGFALLLLRKPCCT